MKTIMRVIPLFVLFMVGTYFLPRFFDNEQARSIVTKENIVSEKAMDSFPKESTEMEQTELPAEGYAYYINQPVDDFIEIFGQPEKKEAESNGKQRWMYGKDNQHAFQIGIEHEQIQDILVTGSDLDVAPFKINMSRGEMYQSASFYPTFELNVQQQTYQLELSENQLHHLPLVAFDNQAYAAIYMDGSTNEINAIHYMSAANLLYAGLYDSTPVIPEKEQQSFVDATAKEQNIIEQVIVMLNNFREKAELAPLTIDLTMSAMGYAVFDYQQEHREEMENSKETPEEDSSKRNVIVHEFSDREQENQTSQESSQDSSSDQNAETLLDEALLKQFLKEKQIDQQKVRLFYAPLNQEPATLVPYWFTYKQMQALLMDHKMSRIGIAIKQQHILLLLDDGSVTAY